MNIRNMSKIIFGSLAALLLATVMVGATFARGGGPGGPGGPGGHLGGEALTIVAEVLDLDVADVRTALRDGQTIAELAGDQTDEVIAALVAAGEERINTGLEDGRLSEEQAATLLENLEQQVNDLVNGDLPIFDRMDRIRELRGEKLAVIAETLDLTEADVTAALQSGQTIAELAGDQTDEVIAALVEAAEAEIAAALEAGEISEERATAMLENLEARITAIVNGELRDNRMDRLRELRGEGLAVIAETLGLTEDDVTSALHSGQTIAELAGDQTDEVIAALVEAAEAKIAAAVESGDLSEERAATMLENLEARITAMVNGERPAGRPGGHHGGPSGSHGPFDGPLFNNDSDSSTDDSGNGNPANTIFSAQPHGARKGGNR